MKNIELTMNSEVHEIDGKWKWNIATSCSDKEFRGFLQEIKSIVKHLIITPCITYNKLSFVCANKTAHNKVKQLVMDDTYTEYFQWKSSSNLKNQFTYTLSPDN